MQRGQGPREVVECVGGLAGAGEGGGAREERGGLREGFRRYVGGLVAVGGGGGGGEGVGGVEGRDG